MKAELAQGIFWRENVPVDPMERAFILMRRAPSMLPRFVSRIEAELYAESCKTAVEREFAHGVIEFVFGPGTISPIRDPELYGFMLLAPRDMVREKIHCILDRVEPTDLYDLCRLHQQYPEEFKNTTDELQETSESDAFLAGIQQCLEKTGGLGSKMQLTADERTWLQAYLGSFMRSLSARRAM